MTNYMTSAMATDRGSVFLMSQAGAKGPASPPKPPGPPPLPAQASPPAPPVTAAKAASPAAPPVAPAKPLAATASLGPMAPKPAGRAPSPPLHPMPSAKQTQIGIPAPAAAQTSPAPVAVAAPTPRRLPSDAGEQIGEQEEDITRAYGARERLQTNPGIGTHGAGDETTPRASREEMQAFVRAAVSEGVASVLGETQRLFRQLERRMDELERRPAMVVAPAVPPSSPTATYEAGPVVVPPARAPMPAYASVVAAPALVVGASVSPRPPVFDIATIERSVHIDIDSALDGRRRNRRIFVFLVVTLVVVFGGLFWMLADSYSPHH